MTAAQRETMELNDLVCFQRIGADREWRDTLGRVVGFPTSTHVRVEVYDRADAAPRSNVLIDEKLEELAANNDKLEIFEEKQKLERELKQVTAEEDRVSATLFKVREAALQRQAVAAAHTRATMEALDEARGVVEKVPQRQWREIRAPGRPMEELIPLLRALMLALREDHATDWEAIQGVMRQPDIVSRVMQLDCTVTPLPKEHRRKIFTELGKLRLNFSSKQTPQTQTQRKPPAPKSVTMEVAISNWLLAQITCSEAREAEERVIDDCYVENQEQVLLVHQVNDMREKTAMLEEQIMEKKLAICGGTSLATLLLEDANATPDSLFYRRMVNDRPVREIILRDSVLVNYGPKEELQDLNEDVFISLTTDEVEQLRNAVRASNEKHDERETENLYAAEAFEQQQIRELKLRMEELRVKEDFTEEDEEEMRQLDTLLQASVRRLESIQLRLRQMQILGRAKLPSEVKSIPDVVESPLHLKFSGDHWAELLKNEKHVENLKRAISRDLSRVLGLPEENFSNYCFSLGSLLVDLTVRHGADVTMEQLQALVCEADFSEFREYYASVTSETTFPLNTPEQEEAFRRAKIDALLHLNFTGAGLPQKAEDFEDDFTDEGASDDEDYRRPRVQIAPMRNECSFEVCNGYSVFALVEVPLEVQRAEMELREAKAREVAAKAAEEDDKKNASDAEGAGESAERIDTPMEVVETQILDAKDNADAAEAVNVAEQNENDEKDQKENNINSPKMDSEELPYETAEQQRQKEKNEEL